MSLDNCNLKDFQYWLFDMDGTILSLENLYFQLFSNSLQKVWNFYDFNKQDFLNEFAGRKVMEALPNFLRKRNILYNDENVVKEITSWRKKRDLLLKKDFNKYVNIKPGIQKLFSCLKKNKKHVGLATSSSRKTTTTLLKYTGFDKYFDVIITGDDVTVGKPNPEPFYKAISLLKANKSKTIIFEDSINGLQAAHAVENGCVVAIHTPGFNDEAIKNEKYVIQSYEPLVKDLQC